MRVAITGAGGYTGGLLVRAHLARGDAVNALARNASGVAALPGVTPFGADLTQRDAVPDAFFENVDVLYHCAAELTRDELMQKVNVQATADLISRARGKIRHWVQVSSLSVYGRVRAGVVTEESLLQPASTYARTKIEADALVAEGADGAFSYAVVRPSGVIGPHMRNRSLYTLINAVAQGRFFFIGAPGAIGNYIHEQNLVDALVLCATRAEAKQRTYNVSQSCTIEHMIDTIAAAIGRAPARLRVPEAVARLGAQIGRITPAFPLTPSRVDALTNRAQYPSTRIENELAFRHGKSIDEALRDVVALWKSVPA